MIHRSLVSACHYKMVFNQTTTVLLLSLIVAFCCQVSPLNAETRNLYIVYMGERQHEDPDLVTTSHHEILTSVLGSKEAALDSIVYSYKHGFSGFSAMLTNSQAKEIAGMPSVLRVQRSRNVRLQTTRSWEFLGVDYKHPSELLLKSNYGEDIIIGIIDTESKSFNDDGYGPIPSRWKGICETGQVFNASNCSGKIIGARWYARGIDENYVKEDYLSPRGVNPHGTHTSSTAAGNPVEKVSFHGLASGTARGGDPRARLAMYKAFWGQEGEGNDATVLAAMDQAIHDGVDILSLSFGVEEDSYGSLHAVAKGITVVYAAGNSGPAPQTVANTAPWVITVAASTIDRSYPTAITLGNNQTLTGQGLYYGPKKDYIFRDLFFGALCDATTLNGTDVKDKVVLCLASNLLGLPSAHFGVAVENVAKGGGKGLIFAQHTADDLVGQAELCDGIACVLVDFDVGTQIVEYMEIASAPVVRISPTITVVGSWVPSPKVAAFSSRGPSVFLPEILKVWVYNLQHR